MSFEYNMPEIPFLTNEHQEKLAAGMYEMSNVLKMYRISRCGQPNEGRLLGEGVVIHPQSG